MTAVVLDRDHGPAPVIWLDVPETHNALNRVVARELAEALGVIGDGDDTVVVIASRGRHFSAGGDFVEMEAPADPVRQRREMRPFLELARALASARPVVIAAVQGAAIGAGVSLACAADLVVATRDARFGLAFSGLGLVPDTALAWSLTRRVGVARAKDLYLTGRRVDADEALALGLVDRIADGDDAVEAAQTLASEILSTSAPHSIETGKRMFEVAHAADLETVLAMEELAQTLSRQTSDHARAVEIARDGQRPTYPLPDTRSSKAGPSPAPKGAQTRQERR